MTECEQYYGGFSSVLDTSINLGSPFLTLVSAISSTTRIGVILTLATPVLLMINCGTMISPGVNGSNGLSAIHCDSSGNCAV